MTVALDSCGRACKCAALGRGVDFQNEKTRNIFRYWGNMFEAWMPSFAPGKIFLVFEFMEITTQTNANISKLYNRNLAGIIINSVQPDRQKSF